MTTAELMTRWRESRDGLTQSDLARGIGMTRGSVWNYENGIASPSLGVVQKYAAFFDVTVSDFWGKPPRRRRKTKAA